MEYPQKRRRKRKIRYTTKRVKRTLTESHSPRTRFTILSESEEESETDNSSSDSEIELESSSSDEDPNVGSWFQDVDYIGGASRRVTYDDFVVPDTDEEKMNLYEIEAIESAHSQPPVDKKRKRKSKSERIELPEKKVESKITKKEKKQGKACSICYVRAIKTTIVDCGHSYMCIECSHKISEQKEPKCSMCFEPITRVIEIFLPS